MLQVIHDDLLQNKKTLKRKLRKPLMRAGRKKVCEMENRKKEEEE